jgi:hypothetical protein
MATNGCHGQGQDPVLIGAAQSFVEDRKRWEESTEKELHDHVELLDAQKGVIGKPCVSAGVPIVASKLLE